MTKDQGTREPLSQPERSGGCDNGRPPPEGASPAVPPRPKRRTFSAAFKARIVEEADACTQPGEIGALLRREGLYSSLLAEWRRQYRAGALQAFTESRRGPKVNGLSSRQKSRYERKIAALETRLRQAETIIEVQKKVSEILGKPLTPPSDEIA